MGPPHRSLKAPVRQHPEISTNASRVVIAFEFFLTDGLQSADDCVPVDLLLFLHRAKDAHDDGQGDFRRAFIGVLLFAKVNCLKQQGVRLLVSHIWLLKPF